MVQRETADDIDSAAADWVAREDRRALTPSEARALEAWIEADSRRAGALLRARAVALRSESAAALGPTFDPLEFGAERRQPPSRRQLLTWGAGVAAAGAAVVAAVSLRAPEAHATGRGEMRLVPLQDGSTVMLNTDTRVTVRFDKDERRLQLLEGEAFITALEDPRPLVVLAGERRITTNGGAFRVRKLPDAPLDILVQQGRVGVRGRTDPAGAAVTLAANTRLMLPDQGATGAQKPRTVSADLVTRELAWREGKIAFEGETLAQAAKTFARYSDTRIVIADHGLASETIVGLYSANDPVGFGRAVAEVFGAQALTEDGAVILRRGGAN